MMSETDFAALVADIRTNGLREPIVMFNGQILDGRHRFRACQLLNITPAFELFDGDDHAARRLADSLNIHRRHLNATQRRGLVMEELKRDPAQSNSTIAKRAHVDDKTVATVRAAAEESSEIPNISKRTDPRTGNQSQPAMKHPRGVRPGAKSSADRAVEIRELIATGHSPQQIAAAIGIGEQQVKKLMATHDITIAIPKTSSRISLTKIIAESVHVLTGATQGIEMVRRSGLNMGKDQATALLEELREAMKSIRWMEQRLREIANA